MMRFLRKYQYHIFLFTIGVFLFGTFIGFGGYFFTSKGSSGDSVAEVNGEKIPLPLFYSYYQRAMSAIKTKPGEAPDAATRKAKRDEALREIVQNLLAAQEAGRYGIRVPDRQVAVSLAQVPAFQEKGAFDPRRYVEALRNQIHLSPQDFEEEQRRGIAFFKLRWLIQSNIKVTDQELAMAYASAHAGKNPATPKEAEAYRQQYTEEKTMWVLNRWFLQAGQRTRIKTHLETVEGIAQ